MILATNEVRGAPMTPIAAPVPAFSLPTPRFASPLARLLERALGFDDLNAIHRSLSGESAARAVGHALAALSIEAASDEKERSRVPTSGGAIVVANLPNGWVDGLLLAAVLLAVRPDVKLLVARRERKLPELGDLLLELDGEGTCPARNARVLREALAHVANGGMLAHFPARVGAAAPLERGDRDGTGESWSPLVATLARRAGAPVLPIHVARSDLSFLRSRLLRAPRLRELLEPNALFARSGRRIAVRIGHPLDATSFARFAEDRELVAYFRLRTALLGRTAATPPRSRRATAAAAAPAALAPSLPRAALKRIVEALPPESVLARAGDLEVRIANASALGEAMVEIGRLRERTFRAVGEGTMLGVDLDRFDEHYAQLFLYDRKAECIAGGYRLGLTDELRARSPAGSDSWLYTATLFHFEPPFLDRVTPGIELGRSFVVAEYQRSHLPLDLLWKGIGAFAARNPRYRTLFGPVSISAEYSGLSRELMIEHIRHHGFDARLAAAVRPRTPPRALSPRRHGLAWTREMLGDVSEVSRMVAEIERGDRAMPILVREYLKLGGRFVGFNLDAGFADCLDGLVVVDLAAMPEKYRRRYLRGERAAG
jgi:putative hemolysin